MHNMKALCDMVQAPAEGFECRLRFALLNLCVSERKHEIKHCVL